MPKTPWAGIEDGNNVIVGGFTTHVTGKFEEQLEPWVSCTLMMKLKDPAPVGVPESNPLADSDIPGGSAPDATEKVYEPIPPLAVKAWLYAVPTVAGARAEGVMSIPQPEQANAEVHLSNNKQSSSAATLKNRIGLQLTNFPRTDSFRQRPSTYVNKRKTTCRAITRAK